MIDLERELTRLGTHRRVLFPSEIDLWLASALFFFGYGVKDGREVLAATPPGRLVCMPKGKSAMSATAIGFG